MKNNESVKRQDYGKIIYLFPFVAFVILLKLRDSESYGFIFEILPILGRTAPYFCLDVLLVGVFIFRGGTFRQLGLCWPQGVRVPVPRRWATRRGPYRLTVRPTQADTGVARRG